MKKQFLIIAVVVLVTLSAAGSSNHNGSGIFNFDTKKVFAVSENEKIQSPKHVSVTLVRKNESEKPSSLDVTFSGLENSEMKIRILNGQNELITSFVKRNFGGDIEKFYTTFKSAKPDQFMLTTVENETSKKIEVMKVYYQNVCIWNKESEEIQFPKYVSITAARNNQSEKLSSLDLTFSGLEHSVPKITILNGQNELFTSYVQKNFGGDVEKFFKAVKDAKPDEFMLTTVENEIMKVYYQKVCIWSKESEPATVTH